LKIIGRVLPALDKEGRPGSAERTPAGVVGSVWDQQPEALLDHSVLDIVSATPLIRGGEFKSPGFKGPE
jgi:hypothetical protein